MSSLLYEGKGRSRSDPVAIPPLPRARAEDPAKYRPDAGLRNAVNTALLLAQPLLLTGEPGTGKTQLASSLAWELGWGECLRFEAKSTSRARDLFYTYDALGHFQAAQAGAETVRPLDYVTYSALGAAILQANEPDDVPDLLPEGFAHPGRRRSVVLIDEVDKAPRDFPNDILTEIEEMYFRVPELGNRLVAADPEMQPVVVITSNSEKHLPDAFLRRCVYYDIPFPDRKRLAEILHLRLGIAAEDSAPFLRDALDLFDALRSPSTGLRKPPSTAELIGWMIALRSAAPSSPNPLGDSPGLALGMLSALVKTRDDRPAAKAAVKEWIQQRSR